jgi:hypothetical protein
MGSIETWIQKSDILRLRPKKSYQPLYTTVERLLQTLQTSTNGYLNHKVKLEENEDFFL